MSCELDAADGWQCTALDYCIRRKDAAKSEILAKVGARMDPVLLLHTKRERCVCDSFLDHIVQAMPCAIAAVVSHAACQQQSSLLAQF